MLRREPSRRYRGPVGPYVRGYEYTLYFGRIYVMRRWLTDSAI